MATPQSVLQQSTAVAQQAAKVAGVSFSPGATVSPTGQIQQTAAGRQTMAGQTAGGGASGVPAGFSAAPFLALPEAEQNRIRANLAGQPQGFNVDVPDTFDSDFLNKAFGQPKGMADILKLIGPAPEATSLADTMAGARASLGLPQLEQRLAELQGERDKIMTSALVEGERAADPKGTFGRPHLRTIQSRRARLGQETSQEIAFLDTEISSVARQVQAGQNAMSMMLEVAKFDAQTARQEYNDRFSRTMTVIDLLQSERDREEKTAQANFNVMTSAMSERGLQPGDLSATALSNWRQAGLDSGLPVDVMEEILATSQQAEIQTVQTRTDDSGNVFFDVLKKNADGTFATESIFRGKEAVSSGTGGDTGLFGTGTQKEREVLLKLRAAGLGEQDIQSIDADVAEFGLEEVLQNDSLNDAQKKALREAYGQEVEEETKLTRESVSSLFGIPDDEGKTGFLGFGSTNKQKLSDIMSSIEKYQSVGYTDKEIIKLMQQE